MKIRRTYVILGGILIVLAVIAWLTPQPVDWTATFDRTDKIPYGSYILYERLKDIFPGGDITSTDKPFYMTSGDSTEEGADCIIVTAELIADDLDIRSMTSFAARGNNVFISAYSIPQLLADTLGISIRQSLEALKADSGYIVHLTAGGGSRSYLFRHEDVTCWIGDADSMPGVTKVADLDKQKMEVRRRITLGTDRAGHANFVKIPFERGAFFIHVEPLAFTNYNMLKLNNNQYAAGCLSQMPDGQVYWQEYYKPFHRDKADTPLRFILSVPAYRWAYYLAIFTAILYMIFAGKRLQRIIPVLAPPVNASLEFTQTVGTLYYQQRDHHDIAVKKMTYLLERIRQYYQLPTGDISSAFRARLAYKTNVDIGTVSAVFAIYENEIQRTRFISEETLIAFNSALEKFYNESGLINK